MLFQSKMAANVGRCKIVTYRYTSFLIELRPNAGHGLLIEEVARPHRTIPMTSSSQRAQPDNTQHSQETDTHAHGGIRTLNLGKRAAADLRLRPRGHRDPHRSALWLSYFPPMAQQTLLGQGLLNSEASRLHSARHTTLGWTLLDEWSAQCRELWQRISLKKRHSSIGGIRTRNPSKWAAADTRLRMRGFVIIIQLNILFIYLNIYLYAYLAA